MIYCQLKNRVTVDIHHSVTLSDVAEVLGAAKAERIALPCPEKPGVFSLDAMTCAKALTERYQGQDVTLLGPAQCYIHRVHVRRRDPTRPLRMAAAFFILLLGSALGLAWFHSDVDMPAAQLMVYRLVTGQEISDPRMITIPYVIGVALGVAVFYALPFRHAVTLLDVKMTAYRQDMEKTEGKDVHDRS